MKNNSCSCGSKCRCKNCSCGPHARFFDALGNESRMHILQTLRQRPKSVSMIEKETGMRQTLISHALRQLEENGLVTQSRNGKFRIYALNATTIEPLMKLIDAHVRQYCAHGAKPCCCKPKNLNQGQPSQISTKRKRGLL